MKVKCWDEDETINEARVGEFVQLTRNGFFAKYQFTAWVFMFDNNKLEWFSWQNIRRME